MKQLKKYGCLFLSALVVWGIFLSACTFSVFGYEASTASSLYKDDPIEKIQAKSYAVMNVKMDRLLLSSNVDERRPVGYLSKVMTLILAYDALLAGTISLDTVLKVPKEATALSGKAPGNSAFLDFYRGETITVEQALQAICINSANDAAYTLAKGIAHSEAQFVEKMNKKAAELGMTNTLFTDCTGYNRTDQYSTAADVAKMTYHLLNTYPQVVELTKEKFMWFKHNTGLDDSMVSTTNCSLKFFSECDGLFATSDSTNGYSTVITALIDNERVICVVLGAADDNHGAALARKLSEQCASQFQMKTIDVAGTYVRRVAVKNGVEKMVKAETKEDFTTFVKVAELENIEREVVPDEDLSAPLEAGARVGEVIYKLGDEEIGRVEIVAAEKVEKAGFFTRLIRWFLSLFGLE